MTLSFNLWVHTKIFNESFNIAFHKPKSDCCDTCEAFAKSVEKTEVEIANNTLHVQQKLATKLERDRVRTITDTNHGILCVDLENVITLPKSNVSPMFYKRKLAVYNTTGHLSTKRKALCVVWHEGQADCCLLCVHHDLCTQQHTL